MLGTGLLASLPRGVSAIGTDLVEHARVQAAGVDLADERAVDSLWSEHGPFDGVIHCAAYTAVDAAEQNEPIAERVNAGASSVLARRCSRSGARLVAVSTDFVFDGE